MDHRPDRLGCVGRGERAAVVEGEGPAGGEVKRALAEEAERVSVSRNLRLLM